jgi:hypothetical protein
MLPNVRLADELGEPDAEPGRGMHARCLAIGVWTWVFAGLTLGFYYTAIDFPFIEFERILWHGWMVAGYCLAAYHAGVLFDRGFRYRETSLALSIVATMMIFTFGWPGLVELGDEIRFQARFRWLIARHQRIVAVLEHDSSLKSGWHRTGETRYYVEQGPPLRVAFALPGGLLDNWEGIVYDPSGAVSRAQELLRQRRMTNGRVDHKGILSLFGGGLFRSRHIKGPWYRCGFT